MKTKCPAVAKEKLIILKVLVGSKAHGLADKDSDVDYRAVYVLPTSKILSLGYKYKGNSWIEGVEDNTSYELGHFLQLATKSNPTILEVFKSPVVETTADGEALRQLFKYVWDPLNAYNAFVGYGLNQRKKFLDKKDNKQDKFAVAYIRTLYNLNQLLLSGTFDVEIKDPKMKKDLLQYRAGKYSPGEIINYAEAFVLLCKKSLLLAVNTQDINKVNEFLVRLRRKHWAL